MIHVSNEFRNLMAEDHRNFLAYAEITLADGTELGTIDNSKIWQGGFRIDDGVTSSGQFTIGSCIINKLTLVLNNIYDDFSEYDFYHAKIVASVGLELSDGKIEKIQKGIYTVDNPQYDGALITLECLDNMYKLDTDYSKVSTKYPATIGEIVREMCDKCDVPLLSATFEGADIVIQERPEDEALTCRQMLLYCCQRICKFARCDTHGRLVIGWFEQEIFERNVKLDGGVFDDGTPLYTTGDKADGGSFNPWNEGAKVDGGTFEDWEAYHNLYSEFSLTVSTDDVVITGIQVTATSRETDEDNKPETFVYGEAGYVLDISQNLLITPGKAQEVAEYIGKKLVGLRFRPMNGTFLADPTIEAGDIAYVTDYKQNTYNCLLTNLTFTVGDSMQISCDAETPRKNSTSRYSELTKSVVQSRKWYEHEKTERELAMETLSEELAHSSGLYMTAQVQDDGSTIYYMHDKSTLEESKIVWKLTADAFGISTDGGKTYPYGLDATGMAILSRIYTIGLDADYINSGALAVRKDGKETFYANVDTGEVRIVADQFSLSSGVTFESTLEDANAYADGAANSAQQAAEKKAADALSKFITETYDPRLADVQKQLDGQFESYYYDYQPTGDNVPASEWTSDELKKAHEGDLFYWKTKGFSYRWTKDGDTYKWVQVQDSGINDALGAASKAQDTADGKRRTFLETPTPPYDKGDLWYGGTSSEVKVCTTSKAADGAYAAGDWEKYDKYIDQAAANSAANSAVNAQTQEFVFNKLTDNGNIKGLFMQDGQMYMNATYINTGTFKVSKGDKETFYANVDTGEVRIVADEFSLSSGVTFESTLEDAKEYADNAVMLSDNLLEDPIGLSTNYWLISGDITRNVEDPVGGNNAVMLHPTQEDNYLSARKANNTPIKHIGQTYAFSVWLKATKKTTIKISLNHTKGIIKEITVDTTWKRYSISNEIKEITENQHVTIGGWGSLTIDEGDIYIYNPCVQYAYSNEEVFNQLTKNGALQGLFMENGNLYLNASFMETGILQSHDEGETFYLDLDKGELKMKATELSIAGQSVNQALSGSIKSIKQEFYLSSSSTSLADGEWSDAQPEWTQGKYIWNRQYVTYGDGSKAYLPSESGVCITGNTGTNANIKIIDNGDDNTKEYYQDFIGKNIVCYMNFPLDSTEIDDLNPGDLVLIKVVNTYDGEFYVYSTVRHVEIPSPRDPNYKSLGVKYKGIVSSGEDGIGVDNIENLYYLSTSNTSAPSSTQSGWTSTMPTPGANQYIWCMQKITYSDGNVTYTKPYCLSKTISDVMTQEEIFNKLTNNGQVKGLFMEDDQLYLNATYINTGALKVSDSTGYTLFEADIEKKDITIGEFKVSDNGSLNITRDKYSLDIGVQRFSDGIDYEFFRAHGIHSAVGSDIAMGSSSGELSIQIFDENHSVLIYPDRIDLTYIDSGKVQAYTIIKAGEITVVKGSNSKSLIP